MNIVIDRIQQGNELAFKELFDEFYQALCVFALTYVKDQVQAADIVQEVFIKYWNRRGDFDNLFKVKSFLYTVVRNDCLNTIRDKKEIREDISLIESDAFFVDNLVEEEAYRIFYNAVESLPLQTREVIQLTLDGLKNAEIAVHMGIAESSVHTLKKLAYKKLKVTLKDYYYLVFIFLP
ncbi:RNA polymerase sigma factor [Gabonibacter massiliensis]|uniref:RNA polymerase sigma factor n=1 Tax=Gabonibacter massiliensis TaxID=1720195 RepID=UPI00073E8BF5|nr:RNA polymerase sigma-70 factor [Gabonibacter massiliensis]